MASLLALPEGGEWIVLLVIVVLIFGANKLPDLTRNVGKALVEFRKLSDKPEPQDQPQLADQDKPQAADQVKPETADQERPQA